MTNSQFIAHAEKPRTFASAKGAKAAVRRDLGKHWDVHGDVLFDTGFDVKPAGDSFGVVIYCDLTPPAAKKLVGSELHGYVIEPQRKEETVKRTETTGTPEPKKTSRRKGQVSVAPTTYNLIQCRAGSKQQRIVDVLASGAVWDTLMTFETKDGLVEGMASKVGGATMDDLRRVCIRKDGVTPWDDNSIRSALYYDLKDKGYGTSTRFENGEPVYSLVLPMGVDEPLPPKAPKS